MRRTSHPDRRRRRGFFLLNMIVTIGLLAGFVIVADRLFRLSMTTTWSTARAQEDAIRLGQAIGVLRDDAWQAQTIESRSPSEVVLTDSGRRGVTWKTDAKTGDAVRVERGNERRWIGLDLAFEAQEGGLLSVSRKGNEIALLRRGPASAGGAR